MDAHAHTHAHTHMHTHAHIHMRTHIRTHACMRTQHMCMHIIDCCLQPSMNYALPRDAELLDYQSIWLGGLHVAGT